MGEEIFIDANVFLEIFLKDTKSEECKALLKLLQDKNYKAATTDYVIYSCILQVQNKLKEIKFIKNVLVFFSSYSNLQVLRPSFKDFYDAVEIMESNRLDFDDSLVVACMKNYGITELASLDRHFDKVKGIKRIVL